MPSISYQSQIGGLGIQTKDGHWINVKFSSKSFVVIISESPNAWTNGRLYSSYHKVMMTRNRTRYSAVFFIVPKQGYTIKAVEKLVDEDHPLQFKPFEYLDYLKLRYAEVNKGRESRLRDYFGA